MPYKVGLPPDLGSSPLNGDLVMIGNDVKPESIQSSLPPLRAWVVEEIRGENGELRAVLICSAFLEDYLWMVWDRSFQPKDNLAVYYAEEIPLLKGKSLEDLREIHKYKLAFPGCRVIQEGADGQRDDKGNALPKLETLNPKR